MSFEKNLNKAIKNIESDRDAIQEVLEDAKEYLKENTENHKTTGMTVAKYFEALQRSNDQLIKLVTLQGKSRNVVEEEEVGEDLYDMIQSHRVFGQPSEE